MKSDENGSVVSSTSFRYDARGKVTSIKQDAKGTSEVNATVNYMQMHGSYMIQAHYKYSHTNTELYSNMTMTGGNMIKMEAATTNYSSELGLYQYDSNINPYGSLGWPDLLLSRQSKNNVIGQQKSYSGSYPTADPYKFEYKYDDNGYPVELIKSFKSPMTQQHLFVTKTVYNY